MAARRTQAQREASARNAAKATAARQAKAAARREGLGQEVSTAYRPILDELDAAIASENAETHCRRALLLLGRVAASDSFDPTRHRAVRDSIREALRSSRT